MSFLLFSVFVRATKLFLGGGVVSTRNNDTRFFWSARYYLTANSCYHDGYLSYDWPDGWSAPSSMACGDVSVDGTGVPEQFW